MSTHKVLFYFKRLVKFKYELYTCISTIYAIYDAWVNLYRTAYQTQHGMKLNDAIYLSSKLKITQ